MKTRFTPRETASILGVNVSELYRRIEARDVPFSLTKCGWVRFSVYDIAEIDSQKIGCIASISPRYKRPKRLITVDPSLAKREPMIYQRDPSKALMAGMGLPWEIRGAMSVLIDIMANHDQNRVPCEPKSYIAGLLGMSQRKWVQTMEPTLIKAHKIKKITRDGVQWYVWHDSIKDLVAPCDSPPAESPTSGQTFSLPEDVIQSIVDHEAPEPRPARQISTDPVPLQTVETSSLPTPSAIDVLRQAGVPVEEHPIGNYFWARADHKEELFRWLEKLPLNEIVARLARAVQEGRVSNMHPNSLVPFRKYLGID